MVNSRKKESHGMSRTTEYGIWCSMISRCYNERTASYKNYGGRGIKVCDKWRISFMSFHRDMGNKPGNDYSLDRIDNDGDYDPKNCKWSTRVEQYRNRRQRKATSTNTSGILGVTRHRNGWRYRKCKSGKETVVGYGATPEEAYGNRYAIRA